MSFSFPPSKKKKPTAPHRNREKGETIDQDVPLGQRVHKGYYKRVSIDQYDKLVAFFRRNPGQVKKAAKYVGIGVMTARRYWHEGNKTEQWPPIKHLLRQEKAEARANLARSLADRILDEEDYKDKIDLELTRIQAVNTSVEEGRMVALSRAATSELQVALVKLSPGVQKLVEALNNELQLYAEMEVIDLDKAFTILRRYASVIKDANTAAQMAMEMERLHLGEPTQHIGLTLDGVEDMSLEDAAKEVEAAAAAVKRAKESGLLDEETVH